MTIKEYLKKYTPNYYANIERTKDYGLFVGILFPFRSQFPNGLLMDYTPFNYSTEYSNGGQFAQEVSYYLCSEYYNVEINDRFISDQISTLETPNALQRMMYNLLQRYHYKWHALYETMLVDNQYDMLDNVNEIFDETTTRTPNLTHSESGSNVYGQQRTETTQTHGNIATSDSMQYGQHETVDTKEYDNVNETTTTTEDSYTDTHNNVMGARDDTQTDTIALLHESGTDRQEHLTSDTHETLNKKYPYDDAVMGKNTDSQTITDTFGTVLNTTNKTVDSHVDTHRLQTGAQTNSITDNMGEKATTVDVEKLAHTDANTILSKTHTDTKTGSVTQGNDVNTSVSNTYTDTHSKTLNETGEDETVITRRRHGNIGTTTSGQLIEDYRKTHYFDLVKIVACDIANEMLSMVWG